MPAATFLFVNTRRVRKEIFFCWAVLMAAGSMSNVQE
jgi:hypothetical protein